MTDYFRSLRIISNEYMTVTREDWSKVRSPGRARRRRRQGHPQRIRYFQAPNPSFVQLPDGRMVGHPETIRQLQFMLEYEERTKENRPPPPGIMVGDTQRYRQQMMARFTGVFDWRAMYVNPGS